MTPTIVGAIIAGAVSLVVGAVTAYFAWKQRHTEVNAPDRLADAFVDLTNSLREEVDRLKANQKDNELRIRRLEQRARLDEATISSLGKQIDWLLSRLRREDRDEFEALFRQNK